jgi:hypothetical protein
VGSVVTNARVLFRERVEAREAVFDYEGDRAQRVSEIWWASEGTKRKQIKRSVVCEWVVSSKGTTKDF